MKRILGPDFRATSNLVGGIPVDSEYIVFIIDTSGSMVNYAWPRVRQEMVNILNIYPRVKGIQILNDMGDYMFSTYRGKWIPDTPGRRNVILRTLNTWTPFSNSSPVEGIERAISSFYDPRKKISIYVFAPTMVPLGTGSAWLGQMAFPSITEAFTAAFPWLSNISFIDITA